MIDKLKNAATSPALAPAPTPALASTPAPVAESHATTSGFKEWFNRF